MGALTSDETKDYREIVIRDPCSYCGLPASVPDHIVPLIESMDDRWENLTGVCWACNSSKGRKPLLLWMLGR
jgi:5-methylcytosine-specific restriction endonuclease McrA